MVRALFDTNILIDYLNAVPRARAERSRYESKSISIISWVEVIVGAPANAADEMRAYLGSFDLIDLDRRIAKLAVGLRKAHRIELPKRCHLGVGASERLHSCHAQHKRVSGRRSRRSSSEYGVMRRAFAGFSRYAGIVAIS